LAEGALHIFELIGDQYPIRDRLTWLSPIMSKLIDRCGWGGVDGSLQASRSSFSDIV